MGFLQDISYYWTKQLGEYRSLFSTKAHQINNHSATIRDLVTIYNFQEKCSYEDIARKIINIIKRQTCYTSIYKKLFCNIL